MKTKLSRPSQVVRKAQPTPGDVHINTPLTNISVAYIQDAAGFVADKVFPVVPVQQQSNLYYLFNKSDFNRDQAKPRAPGSQSAGGGFNVTTDSYSCLVEAFHKDIDDQLRANADSVLSLDRAATEWVTQILMIRRERKWATKYFTTGIWASDHTPSVLWDAGATSNPALDVGVARTTIQQSTGFRPNVLVVNPQVHEALRTNPTVKEQFKYTSSDSIDEAMLARYFGQALIDGSLVAGVYETAAEGATSSMGFIGGKNALLVYAAPSPSLMAPSAGYTFAWSGFTGGINGTRIKRIRAELESSDRIEGEHALDMKVVATSLGYMLNAVIS